MDTAHAQSASVVAVDEDATEPTDPLVRDVGGRRPHAALVIAILVALLALPLVVALIALRHPRWYPLLDMAQTEIRIRDVASSHPPLIGLAGRIGTYGPDGGSHPGPISFYAIWPFYQLFGASGMGDRSRDRRPQHDRDRPRALDRAPARRHRGGARRRVRPRLADARATGRRC